MKTSSIVWAVLIIIVVAGGGWYWYSMQNGSPLGTAGLNGSPDQGNLGQQGNGTPQAPKTAPSPLASAATPALGSYLISSVTGMTLYLYTKDTSGVSNCSGTCAVNWPPYIVEPGVTFSAATGINGQLGTVTRADGALQLTYNGIPLYTYIKDTKPGDTVGQGVGSVWYVVKP